MKKPKAKPFFDIVYAFDKARQEFFNTKYPSHVSFRLTYLDLVLACERADAPANFFRLAAEFLPAICFDFVTQRVRPDMATSKAFVALLRHEDVFTRCLVNPDGEKAMAWCLLQRAYDCEHFTQLDTNAAVHHVLLRWLGRGLPAPERPTTLDTVSALYGGHTATLELLGLTLHRQLPSELWGKGLPILPNTPAREGEATPVLPMDLLQSNP